jgi:hypothetical protein
MADNLRHDVLDDDMEPVDMNYPADELGPEDLDYPAEEMTKGGEVSQTNPGALDDAEVGEANSDEAMESTVDPNFDPDQMNDYSPTSRS